MADKTFEPGDVVVLRGCPAVPLLTVNEVKRRGATAPLDDPGDFFEATVVWIEKGEPRYATYHVNALKMYTPFKGAKTDG